MAFPLAIGGTGFALSRSPKTFSSSFLNIGAPLLRLRLRYTLKTTGGWQVSEGDQVNRLTWIITRPCLPFLFLSLLTANTLRAAEPAKAFDHTHGAWTEFLEAVLPVSDSLGVQKVDYARAQALEPVLNDYLQTLASISEATFLAFEVVDQQAFLINLYNAAMIKKVLSRYPDIRSVWDFGRIFNHPFKHRFISLFGKKVSLDDVEHGWLRGRAALFDPRVHFAVNCASIGCPPLRRSAYAGASLDAALDDQAARFLSDRTKNEFDRQTMRLILSPLFEWYEEDFSLLGQAGPYAYLARFAKPLGLSPFEAEALGKGELEITWSTYDWSLNAAATNATSQ